MVFTTSQKGWQGVRARSRYLSYQGIWGDIEQGCYVVTDGSVEMYGYHRVGIVDISEIMDIITESAIEAENTQRF